MRRQRRLSVGLGELLDPPIERLKTLAATGGQPTALANPPTVTLGVANAATAIPGSTTTYNWDSSSFLRTAGEWKQFGTVFPDTLAGRGVTTTFQSGSSDTGYGFALEFYFTGRYIEPQVLGKGFRWQLFVDDEYVALPDVPSFGGGYRCLIDFGSVVTNKSIRIEHQGNGQMALITLLTESTATVVVKEPYTDRVVIFGDSYCGETGTTALRQALSYKICKELGYSDHRISTSGGTGWIEDNPGVQLNGFDRWTEDVVDVSPTLFISLMGGNDMGDGSEALISASLSSKIDELRAAHPDIIIHMFNPPNVSAPTVPSYYQSISDIIEAACVGKYRVYFHDISDVSFTKVDGVHPDAAGHTVLYKAIYNKIADTHGLHTVS